MPTSTPFRPGPIKTPDGKSGRFCSMRQMDTGTDVSRFTQASRSTAVHFAEVGPLEMSHDFANASVTSLASAPRFTPYTAGVLFAMLLNSSSVSR